MRSPYARVVFDPIRRTHALLDPERVIFLSPSTRAILDLCDGRHTTHEIISLLQSRYPNAPIETDVPRLLAVLHAKGALAYSPLAPVVTVSEAERNGSRSDDLRPPLAMTAELTFRCPLRCGYCSNPIDLDAFSRELSVDQWLQIIDEAADAGVLQCSFSGGEPLLFDGLETLIARARTRGMYTNLITSAYGLTDARLDALVQAGIEHIQVSVQHTDAKKADELAGINATRSVHEQKLWAARAIVAKGVALSINVVLHRETVEFVGPLIELAEELGAVRIELASVQSHGWALRNRAALLPSHEQVQAASRVAKAAKARIGAKMRVVYVVPDYYAGRPKPCMDGWGRKFLTVAPDGRVLPCPGAHALPFAFDRALQDKTIEEIWRTSEPFNAFRGTRWMREPCTSCDERERDFGGCRCQAFALTGDARNTDPTCHKSPNHAIVLEAREQAQRDAPLIQLRRYHRDR
jgi:pyrroloquinoline quinone biosynthesis protein E